MARLKDASYWSVAVWWGDEGYGVALTHDSEAKALDEQRRMIEQGYQHVDVWKTTIEVVCVLDRQDVQDAHGRPRR